MINRQSNRSLTPNPVTFPRHRRQSFWQIIFPIILGGIVLIALGVLITLGPNQQVSRWGSISTIILILPLFLMLLIAFAIFGGLAYGLARLLRILPAYTHMAQIYTDHFGKMIQNFADKIVQPIITVKSGFAGIQTVFKKK